MHSKKRFYRRKSAWQRFSERFAKRMKEHQAEFQELYLKYQREQSSEKKQKLKSSYLKKIAPTFMVIFFEEIASTSEADFEKMMLEIGKAMEGKLAEMAEDYLDFELMLKEPITVFEEMFLTVDIWRSVQKELSKHEKLFGDPNLTVRLVALMSMREFSLELGFATLRPFFEVLNMAKNRLGIDENWATSTFALNLEESLVKKKLLEFGVSEKEMKVSFYKLLEKTAELIESREKRHLETDIFLSVGYRMIRNKLDHEGYRWKPTRKETNRIVIHLLKLANSLWKS